MTEETKECKCCECREKLLNGLKEFAFKTLIVYVGVTLAILTGANVLKPKHHCPFAGQRPVFERQIPPSPMMQGNFRVKMHHNRAFKHSPQMKGNSGRPDRGFEKRPLNSIDKTTTPTPPIPQKR